MTLLAVTGKSQGLNAVETAIQATDQALSQLGRHRVSLAFVVASHDYPVRDVVNGVSGLLSDTPLFGFSTLAQITEEGLYQRSVVVTLIAGDQVEADGDWWSESDDKYPANSGEALRSLCTRHPNLKALLVAIDLHHQDPQSLIDKIPAGQFCLAGCLVGGDLSSERSYQIGGSHFGQHGIAALAIRGNIEMGISSAHGWQPVGIYSRITHSSGNTIHTLDGRPAADIYAQHFGYPAKDWTYPPLNQLVRLYPLGFELESSSQSGNIPYHICSPQRIELDGSLLMSSQITKSKMGNFLVGSMESCLGTARLAAQGALQSLGGAKPVLALVFSDIAWHMMLSAQPGAEIKEVREVIGANVPIIGGYTYGQIRSSELSKAELLNQHFQIVLLGDPG